MVNDDFICRYLNINNDIYKLDTHKDKDFFDMSVDDDLIGFIYSNCMELKFLKTIYDYPGYEYEHSYGFNYYGITIFQGETLIKLKRYLEECLGKKGLMTKIMIEELEDLIYLINDTLEKEMSLVHWGV